MSERGKWIWTKDSGWVSWEKVQAAKEENHSAYIQDDTMPPLEHPCDGRIYESKSAFRRATKAAGCVEIGNDLLGKRDKRRIPLPDKAIESALRSVANEYEW